MLNGWYNENYTGHLDAILHHRQVFGAAGQGRIAAAARADYATAAATVLTEDNHEGRAYELSGDTSFSLADLAAEIYRQSAAGSPTGHWSRRSTSPSSSGKECPRMTPSNSSTPIRRSLRVS